MSQVQFVFSVQFALRHEFSVHTKPLSQSKFTVQLLLQPDNAGVGVGVGDAGQVQFDLSVQDGFRHALSVQMRPEVQSAFTVQELLHPTNMIVGVGVLVGVLVGVFVGVSAGVPVGVSVGVPVVSTPVGVGVPVESVRLNVSVHASAAFGVVCGTLGATGVVLVSCWLVRRVTTPSPAVIRVMMMKYQYCLINFIYYSLHLYGYDGGIRRYRVIVCPFTAGILCSQCRKCASVYPDLSCRASDNNSDLISGHEC
jgi:hypothetical protein